MSRFSGLDDCRAISEPSSVAAAPATGSRVRMVKLFRIALALINTPPHRLNSMSRSQFHPETATLYALNDFKSNVAQSEVFFVI